MSLIMREETFDSGHRIANYPGKCINPHGHTYFVRNIRYTPHVQHLDELGMIIDLGDFKGPVREYLKNKWDHKMIIPEDEVEIIAWHTLYRTLGLDVEALLPLRHTTVEYMQMLITEELNLLFPDGEITLELYEGPAQGWG